eukprot:TRINITY_DN7157_c0_g1_i1.p1 TRINITY_DN7157_c0_g1~~TRINITY_DN7157_c0_g1_i1.p1  ORF type:complete len:343 (+),score=85.81 TRINITY_DN7157_c0_g1_i1:123-1151(+)
MAQKQAQIVASEALAALTEQVFSNMKLATPTLEELAKTAKAYQVALAAANTAANAFIDSFGKVAVTATRTRGATHELGATMQKLVSAHHEIIKQREVQAQKLTNQFVNPLQKRLKNESKTFPKMEDDFKSETKHHKNDLKRAGQSTVKAQKSANKNAADASRQAKMEQALEAMSYKSALYEAFNQRTLRNVLVEERRRYAYLVDNWCSVFDTDFSHNQQHAVLIKDAIALTNHPDSLPPTSEQLIASNGSNGLMYEAPPIGSSSESSRQSSGMQPSPLTQELQSMYHPPGAPVGGLDSGFEPSEEQINPRRSPTGKISTAVPLDLVLAQQRAGLSTSPVKPS